MSGDWDEDLCKKALVLVEELCFNSPRGYSQSERCQEFSYLLRGSIKPDPGEPTPPTTHLELVSTGVCFQFRLSLRTRTKLCFLCSRFLLLRAAPLLYYDYFRFSLFFF